MVLSDCGTLLGIEASSKVWQGLTIIPKGKLFILVFGEFIAQMNCVSFGGLAEIYRML